ncbi:MAG: hypothetical protein ACLFS7_08010 [Desulfosudaceae bacterium]
MTDLFPSPARKRRRGGTAETFCGIVTIKISDLYEAVIIEDGMIIW